MIITNIPVPYRLPIFEILNKEYQRDFLVVYCAEKELNRKWKINSINFNHVFLKEKVISKKDGFNFVHNNFDIFNILKNFNPDIVITTGFNPTHLYAWFYSKLLKKRHICMTDGWIESEKDLSILHKIIRKIVFSSSDAFIGASKNSLLLYESYGIKKCKLFQSHLCIDNKKFDNKKLFKNRVYDVMFSGHLSEHKMPLFFYCIVEKLIEKIPDLRVLILGTGPLEKELLLKLENLGVDFFYPGFVEQNELPMYYSDSKIFLFTTKIDAWGVVVNEAMASGTPVISTPYAGVIDDLLIDSYNGFILDADVNKWVSKIEDILSDEEKWQELSNNAKNKVQEFNFEIAAKGIIDAAEYAYEK